MTSSNTSQFFPAMLLAVGTWSLMLVLMVALNFLLTGHLSFAYAISTALMSLGGVVLSWLLFLVAQAVSRWRALPRWSMLVLAVAGLSAVLAIVDAVFAVRITDGLPQAKQLPISTDALNSFGVMIWQFGLLGAAYATLEANRLSREQERQLAEVRQLAVEAERNATAAKLSALRYQLNPHFLFNALNAISSLVITRRNAEAEDMLSGLSDFLRATLSSEPDALVSVDEELATLQTYLEVEAKRFTDRLLIDADCPPSLRSAQIPGFILQPLVENAIKYAVAPARTPTTLRIAVRAENAALVLRISDDGRATTAPRAGTGVGHANIRERLKVLYGETASLETERLAPGFCATIRIPLADALGSLREAAE